MVKKKKKITVQPSGFTAMLCLLSLCLMGCGSSSEEADVRNTGVEAAGDGEAAEEITETEGKSGLESETAEDGHIDFAVIQKENPEIFAWLYVPGTDIDTPVLQSAEADDFYQMHLPDKREGSQGALYTEMANLMNMCDFNTVIHGRDTKETDLFYGLHQFENPDFFDEHLNLYVYLPDNVLTYTIFASYYDEGSDILRRYDYTSYEGCQQYLDTFYGIREMEMNVREGWEDLTPGHFILTLNGETDVQKDRQYVVLAALVGDAAGRIDRIFYRE